MKRVFIMKTKLSYITAIPLLVLLALALNVTALAQSPKKTASDSGEPKPGTVLTGNVIVATPITKEDAAKKYPAPSAGYPVGDRPYTHIPGHVLSPYPPHQEYECSKIARGGLVLDTHANKVFVRP
jgi:hypothetical protein